MKSSAHRLKIFISISIGIWGIAGCGPRTPSSTSEKERPDFAQIIPPDSVVVSDTLISAGKKTYTQACHACHGGDGMGMPAMQPALVGSERLSNDPYYVIEWVLRGSAMLRGQRSEWPVIMPGHKHLSDQELAAIISYVRAEFGKGASPVSPEMVKLVRDSL